MKMNGFHIILSIAIPLGGWAQNANLNVFLGNRVYETQNFENAENLYLEALKEDPNHDDARFNLGNSYFRQDKKEDAEAIFRKIAYDEEVDSGTRAQAFHNLGNIFLTGEEPKLKEAIHAYKSSLRLNPKDDATRYNLAVAQKLLEENPQQQQQQQDQNQNQDQNKDQQQQQDQQQNENQDQNQDQQQQNENQDEKKDQDQQDKQDQNGDQDKKDEEQQQDQQPGEPEQRMSKEDAERLLEMMENEEEQVQDKLKKKKIKVKEVPVEKDW